jgi:cell division protein FtsZ
LYEVDEAANRVRQEVDPNANIIVGSALDDTLNGRMRVSVVATGIEVEEGAQRPVIAPRLAAVAGRPIPAEEAPAAEEAAAVTVAEAAPESAPESVPNAMVGQDGEAVTVPAKMEANEPPALPLTFGQRVPAPKPPQAEPDPLTRRAKPTADVSVDDAPFIAPQANLPEKDRAPLQQPGALAEAEAVNPTDRPAKSKSKPGRFSLFRRKQAVKAVAPAPVQPKLESPGPEKMRQAAPARMEPDVAPEPAAAPLPPTPEPAAGHILEPAAKAASELSAPDPAIPEPADPDLTAPTLPASASPAPEPAPSLAPPRTEEDLLEIPSFLRRQAN